MPEFVVRARTSGWTEYIVKARGPNDAIEKVYAGHESAVFIDQELDEEIDPRDVWLHEPKKPVTVDS